MDLIRDKPTGMTAYKGILILASLGLLCALINIGLWGTHRQAFAWLALYIPGLWMVWILYVLLRSPEQSLFKVLALWISIDLVMLLFFVGNSIGMQDWYHAPFLDIVLYYIVYPLIQPTGFIALYSKSVDYLLFGYLPGFSDSLVNRGVAAPIAIWSVETLAILPQTAIIILLGQIVATIRKRNI